MGEAKRRFGNKKHIEPGSPEWNQRVSEMLAEERECEPSWHYCSFADEVFRGVAIIKAHGITDAAMRTKVLGINPGGELMCVAMADEIVAMVPESLRNKLLTKEEVMSIWPDAKSLREHEAGQP